MLQDATVKKDSTRPVKTSVSGNLNVLVYTMVKNTKRAKFVQCTAIIGRYINTVAKIMLSQFISDF